MVHTWVSLCNNRLSGACINPRVLRIFKNDDTMFYGDYELDIYIGTKHDYANLLCVVDTVVHEKGTGWIRNIHNVEQVLEDRSLTSIIGECGWVPHKELPKLLPRKGVAEAAQPLLNCWVYRNDGNFKMVACETGRYYYVICFATS